MLKGFHERQGWRSGGDGAESGMERGGGIILRVDFDF